MYCVLSSAVEQVDANTREREREVKIRWGICILKSCLIFCLSEIEKNRREGNMRCIL